MTGSYKHVVDDDTGALLGVLDMTDMLENGGDVYEAVEEMYGMIWYLAGGDPARVAQAAMNYRHGLDLSPGTNRDQ